MEVKHYKRIYYQRFLLLFACVVVAYALLFYFQIRF